MRTTSRWVLLGMLWASPAGAQTTLDRLTPAPSNPTIQRAAEVTSWVTMGTNVALDAVDAWRADDRVHAYAMMGLRDAIVTAGVWGLKTAVHRQRPCAPVCGLDAPDASFPSGHTAWAFQAVAGSHKGLRLSLAVGTGAGRIVGGKHWLTDVIGGGLLGWGASFIR